MHVVEEVGIDTGTDQFQFGDSILLLQGGFRGFTNVYGYTSDEENEDIEDVAIGVVDRFLPYPAAELVYQPGTEEGSDGEEDDHHDDLAGGMWGDEREPVAVVDQCHHQGAHDTTGEDRDEYPGRAVVVSEIQPGAEGQPDPDADEYCFKREMWHGAY